MRALACLLLITTAACGSSAAEPGDDAADASPAGDARNLPVDAMVIGLDAAPSACVPPVLPGPITAAFAVASSGAQFFVRSERDTVVSQIQPGGAYVDTWATLPAHITGMTLGFDGQLLVATMDDTGTTSALYRLDPQAASPSPQLRLSGGTRLGAPWATPGGGVLVVDGAFGQVHHLDAGGVLHQVSASRLPQGQLGAVALVDDHTVAVLLAQPAQLVLLTLTGGVESSRTVRPLTGTSRPVALGRRDDGRWYVLDGSQRVVSYAADWSDPRVYTLDGTVAAGALAWGKTGDCATSLLVPGSVSDTLAIEVSQPGVP